jgi:hypothetical protein
MPSGSGDPDVSHLRATIIRIEYWDSTTELGYMLAGEAARDILEAPELARRYFLAYAETQSTALWAPKALLAVLDLSALDSEPETNGSTREPTRAELRRRLQEDYGSSPYVRAITGAEGTSRFTYEELEFGLQRQLERLERLADEVVRERLLGR